MLTTAAGRFCYFNRPGSPGGGNFPTVMQENIGFNFPGERNAQAFFTFYEENGTSYTWELFESPDPPPSFSFVQIASGSDVITKISETLTITYYGETVYDYYFFFRVTVSNGSGSATLDSTFIQNVFPT